MSLAWVGIAGIVVGIGLIVLRARSPLDAIFDLQFRIPRDPVALVGNILVLASALFLIILWLVGNNT
ncbi:MAG: hypothetical protein ACE5PT_04040 [Gemmatimonadales bacterium]